MQTKHDILDLGHVQLGYKLRGTSGPPVLLVMGLAMPGEGWMRQVDDLSQDHQVCWFDNRGVGKSSTPKGLYSTQKMAEETWALVDHLGWESVHVVGVSMGGMISQQLLVQQPERVRSLTLIASAAVGRKAQPTAEGVKRWIKVQSTKDVDERMKALAHLLFSEKTIAEGRVDMGTLGRDLAAGRARGQGMLGQLAAVFGHNAKSQLAIHQDKPVLCIVGQDDVLVSPRNTHELAKILAANLLEIPDAGHGVSSEHPELVNAAIRKHILAV
jgi:pimeloyl-ACP methyl ester carboxylesterase